MRTHGQLTACSMVPERLERYRRVDQGEKAGYALLELKASLRAIPARLISCRLLRSIPKKVVRQGRSE